MNYRSLQELVAIAQEEGVEFWEIVVKEEAVSQNIEPELVFEQMRSMYHAMKQSVAQYAPKQKSPSGMSGGDAEKLRRYREENKTITGDFLSKIMETAMMVAESNACMKKIVAAPTAGSCGVLPAVLETFEREKGCHEDTIVEALFVAAGIGEIIALNASISGAVGGCQAEIGSASAMAAGSVAYLEGGSMDVILQAATLALKNMLGLACDPVAGLVEVPCIKRNVSGAINAVVAAQMALAGIRSVIPPDEVIAAMAAIGRQMPVCLKETGTGGLAATRTAKMIAASLAEERDSRTI